jgi:hypothetical protein
MAVARQRIAAAGRLDQNIRPENSRLDVDGRDLGDADADFVLAEPRPLVPDDRLVRDLDDRREKPIPGRQPARLKCFRSHEPTLTEAPNPAIAIAFQMMTQKSAQKISLQNLHQFVHRQHQFATQF